MANVTIPYSPRQWASRRHLTAKRWIVLVLHRRAGKTVAVLNHLQRDALTTPDSRFAYIAPFYKQAKNIAWDLLKHYARPIPNVRFNESELSVTYPNSSKLQLYGADNPDSLRGIALWGVAFDEYSQQPSNIFTEIIRPALADHQGYAIWIGTPKGKNELYRLHQYGLTDDGWLSMLLTAEDTSLMPAGELEDAKKLMSDDEFNQEFMCSFEAAVKGAYYAAQLAEARKQGRIKVVPYDPALKVQMVSDLGVGPNFATGFYQKSAGETRMIDFWEGSNKDGIPQAVKAAKEKPYVYGKWFLPHDAEATSIDTGKTRVATIKELWPNIEIVVIPKLSVDEGISKGRLMFSHLWIDETNCQQFLDYIAQYRQEWDDNKGMFKEKPEHDFTSHAADVHRGAAVIEDQMTNTDYTPYKQPDWEPETTYFSK
jgi:phage terminase large subunit